MVEHADERGLFVPVRCRGEQRPEPAGEDDADEVDAEGEDDDVLADDADGFAREPHEERQRLEGFAHENDVAGLGGDIGAGADSDAHGSAGEGRGIVDAVADKGDGIRRAGASAP